MSGILFKDPVEVGGKPIIVEKTEQPTKNVARTGIQLGKGGLLAIVGVLVALAAYFRWPF